MEFFAKINWIYVAIISYVSWHFYYGLEGFLNGADDPFLIAPYSTILFYLKLLLPNGYVNWAKSQVQKKIDIFFVTVKIDGNLKQKSYTQIIEEDLYEEYARTALGEKTQYVRVVVVGIAWLMWPVTLFMN